MGEPTYTVLVVPERSASVRRYQIPLRWLVRLGYLVLVLVGAASYASVSYLEVLVQASRNRIVKAENIELKTRLRLVEDEVERIDVTLRRIDQLSAKIRAMTELSDPERNLAIGPTERPSDSIDVLYAPDERTNDKDEPVDSPLGMRLLESKIDTAATQSVAVEARMKSLASLLDREAGLMDAIPSVRPVPSQLLTSTFGLRLDPYTNRKVMHKGVDFASEHGTDVIATAGGTVVFAGTRGEYGNTVVIHHGYGFQTHYAHLSTMRVQVGDVVTRGQVVGGVGKTGRTTGVHLHYEVRRFGIPQNPEQFLLDQP